MPYPDFATRIGYSPPQASGGGPTALTSEGDRPEMSALTPGPEIPDEVLKLAAQHFHWTYHRQSACQCEIDEADFREGRRMAEALWPAGYRAGREDAARDIGAAPWADEGPYARLAARIARGGQP